MLSHTILHINKKGKKLDALEMLEIMKHKKNGYVILNENADYNRTYY